MSKQKLSLSKFFLSVFLSLSISLFFTIFVSLIRFSKTEVEWTLVVGKRIIRVVALFVNENFDKQKIQSNIYWHKIWWLHKNEGIQNWSSFCYIRMCMCQNDDRIRTARAMCKNGIFPPNSSPPPIHTMTREHTILKNEKLIIKPDVMWSILNRVRRRSFLWHTYIRREFMYVGLTRGLSIWELNEANSIECYHIQLLIDDMVQQMHQMIYGSRYKGGHLMAWHKCR